MRALAVEGIQRGHMALHARNIAIACGLIARTGSCGSALSLRAGAPTHLVNEIAAHIVRIKKVAMLLVPGR